MNKILTAMFFVAVSCGVYFVASTEAAPRQSPFVTKTSRNEGNRRSDIAVSLSSTAWTAVLSADVRRRDAVLETLSTASYTVCLSSHNTAAITCAAATKGMRLEPGGTYTDYNEAALYARIADAGSGVYMYGQEHYDNDDSSSFQ